jgi:AcrR family transcriptional regulator
VSTPRGDVRRRPIAEAGGLLDICEAAVRLFAEHGYDATGMKDIAAALKVQAPSLYNYVNSKRELLDMLCLETFRGMDEALEMGFSLSSDVTEQVRRGMEEQVRYRIRHPYHVQTVSRETLNMSEPVRTEAFALREHQRDLWRGVIERGVQEGRFTTPSPELSALVVVEWPSWVHVKHFSMDTGVPETQLVYWFGDLALQMLTRSTEAPVRVPDAPAPAPNGAGRKAASGRAGQPRGRRKT